MPIDQCRAIGRRDEPFTCDPSLGSETGTAVERRRAPLPGDEVLSEETAEIAVSWQAFAFSFPRAFFPPPHRLSGSGVRPRMEWEISIRWRSLISICERDAARFFERASR